MTIQPQTVEKLTPMTRDDTTGVWSVKGDATWMGKYYLYEVEVYVPKTGKIEKNLVTDPYSFSLSTNSQRSQMVDLADAALKPAGWDTLAKPAAGAPGRQRDLRTARPRLQHQR